MTPKSRLIIVVIVVCAVWLIPFLTSPAQAATQVHSQITTKDGKHCVTQIAPIHPGQVSSDILSFKCFKTLSESIAAATDGHIHLPTNATGQDVHKALQAFSKVNAQDPNNVNVIAVFWTDANYQGNSDTDITTGPPCTQQLHTVGEKCPMAISTMLVRCRVAIMVVHGTASGQV